MSVYKIDNTNDSQVESLLIENGIEYNKFESSTHAFVADVVADAAVVYPEFESLTSEEVIKISDALVAMDWTNWAGGFIDGLIGRPISEDK